MASSGPDPDDRSRSSPDPVVVSVDGRPPKMAVHRLQPMQGRDPGERHRPVNPLELRSLGWSLVILAASPFVTVGGYETVGHRHIDAEIGAMWTADTGRRIMHR